MIRIAIAGAGIGGLTAALCLHEEGFEVKVFEAVPAIRPLGVGINVMPHSSKVLHDLGLGPALDRIAIRTRCIEYRTKYGQLIQSDPRSIEAGFAAPQYSIHRGEFQFLLLDAVRERLGADAVETGKLVEGFSQTDDNVTVRFADGNTHEADLLIGADGLRSKVREQLHPNEGPLCYEGTMMFRGAVEMDQIGDGRTMVIAGNHDVKFVMYPISEKLRKRGKALTNWVAEVRVERPRHIQDADWTRGATLDYVTPFKQFQMSDMDLVKIMQASEGVTEFPMIDRDPLPFWTQGRVTLLGDAAHPMYPIGANGASQAMMDGRVLVDCLAENAGPEGLKAYEEIRLPVATRVVLTNREGGPEQVLDIADARVKGPDDKIEDLITAEELEQVAASYRNIAGFQKKTA
ncbi:flavin-dependent oxidoreductase [Chelativorans salis]|uniref:Flavin-dependent oxidoreductase n=1 Tax=Chelativorans salis TaxID=2978478 RepID=A0ABT2LYJ8_9HYPH|nr:flavin-dependent oxidoreductase [Chelativorans sp. EGI FJ00035]MCT7378289.1 flavin-dependent oxidoreductase [Chelativorans sp. EGI FJ00035]